MWDINIKDQSLSVGFVKTDTAKGGSMPASMSLIGDKAAVLNTDMGNPTGFSIYDFRNSKNGKATNAVFTKLEGQQRVGRSAYAPKTGSYFLTDYLTGIVSEVKVDGGAKPSIVKTYQQSKDSTPLDLVVAMVDGKESVFSPQSALELGAHHECRYAYILSPNIKSLQVLDLGDGAGRAKNFTSYNFLTRAKKAGISVSTRATTGLAVYMK